MGHSFVAPRDTKSISLRGILSRSFREVYDDCEVGPTR